MDGRKALVACVAGCSLKRQSVSATKPRLNLTGPSRSLRNRALFPWSAKREIACAATGLVSDLLAHSFQLQIRP
jgi:hypothetical protein